MPPGLPFAPELPAGYHTTVVSATSAARSSRIDLGLIGAGAGVFDAKTICPSAQRTDCAQELSTLCQQGAAGWALSSWQRACSLSCNRWLSFTTRARSPPTPLEPCVEKLPSRLTVFHDGVLSPTGTSCTPRWRLYYRRFADLTTAACSILQAAAFEGTTLADIAPSPRLVRSDGRKRCRNPDAASPPYGVWSGEIRSSSCWPITARTCTTNLVAAWGMAIIWRGITCCRCRFYFTIRPPLRPVPPCRVYPATSILADAARAARAGGSGGRRESWTCCCRSCAGRSLLGLLAFAETELWFTPAGPGFRRPVALPTRRDCDYGTAADDDIAVAMLPDLVGGHTTAPQREL